MPKIYLIGFRGTGGFNNPRYQQESALIKAGHVGIQFEGESQIVGFHPNSNALAQAGNEHKVINLLKEHIPQQGCLHDDTTIFSRAYELYEHGERTEVLYLEYEFSDEEFGRIRETTQNWLIEQKVFWYNFPNADGNFEPDEYSCASFPKLLGIPIPSNDGNLAIYIETMRQKGAQSWKRES